MSYSLIVMLLLTTILLSSCQSHRREEANRATATLNIMDQVAMVDILHEKNGDAPSRRFATWQEYWRHHFATLHYIPSNRGDDSMRNVGNLHLVFVKQKRAELGLPPFKR